MKYRLETAYGRTREILIKTKEKNKKYYDRNVRKSNVGIGDKIIVEKQPYHKHSNKCSGPFIVDKIDGENVLIKDNAKKEIKLHKNRLIKTN